MHTHTRASSGAPPTHLDGSQDGANARQQVMKVERDEPERCLSKTGSRATGGAHFSHSQHSIEHVRYYLAKRLLPRFSISRDKTLCARHERYKNFEQSAGKKDGRALVLYGKTTGDAGAVK